MKMAQKKKTEKIPEAIRTNIITKYDGDSMNSGKIGLDEEEEDDFD